jgi:hypothetical protein
MPLEKALIKLADAGAPISYRPDQLPKLALKVPGGQRSLSAWLTFLLRDTELTFREGPAGYLILPDPALFQRTFTTYGIITDAGSGERLIGATILDLTTGEGVLANEYGFYSLLTQGGRKQLRISYTGYDAWEEEFVLRADTELDIRLSPAGNLPPIEVTASRPAGDKLHLTESKTSIGYREVNLFNGPGGEADVLNIARMLPGVTSGADGVGGLVVRGSNSGHNLVLLDGVPVYNLNHAAGLFSIFNSAAIRRADVYTDGMPARFGGRIGGVLDIHTRDGNLYEPEITVGSSLLAANLTAEGPIERGKSSFLVSGRYFWGGELLRRFSALEKEKYNRSGEVDYAVYDLNIKINQQVGKCGHLYFSAYRGLDNYANDAVTIDSLNVLPQGGTVLRYTTTQRRAEEVAWGNTVAALRYNHLFSDRFFGNFRLSYSDLLVRANFERSDTLLERTRQRVSSDISSGRFGSEIKQVGLAFDGQIKLSGNQSLRFGTSLDFHRFLPQIRSGRIPLSRHPELSSLRESDVLRSFSFDNYVSFTGSWRWLHYRFGLRGQVWRNDKTFFDWSPRVMLAGAIDERNRWRFTYERLVQPIHLVSTTVIGLPTDLWVPTTEEIEPSTASQLSLGYDHDFGRGWGIDVTGYYRDLRNLVDYTEIGVNDEWLDKLSVGKGFASGLEVTLRHTSGRLRGWLAYTLAESRRQFDERINIGRPFPFQYDRRHGIKLLLTMDVNPFLQLSATWRYGSGSFYSISTQSFLLADPTVLDSDEGRVIDLVSSKNGFQLRDDHRLDVSAQFSLTRDPSSRFHHTLNVGVYNLYSRHNPIFYDLRTRFFTRGSDLVKKRDFVQVFFGGILPTLSYSMTFRGKARELRLEKF